MVAGLYNPKEGEILINGRCLQDFIGKSLRDHVAMVFHDGGLLQGSVLENIALGASNATFEQIQEAARMAAAHVFIIAFPKGYNYEVGSRGEALSSGPRQRIA